MSNEPIKLEDDEIQFAEPGEVRPREYVHSMEPLARRATLEELRTVYQIAAIEGNEKRRMAAELCMLVLTDVMDEHPEGWDHPCLCDLCKSYS